MKILILTKKFPYPLREGEPIAVTYLSRSLVANGCEVSLLSMNTTKHFFDLSELPPGYNHFKTIRSVNVDNRISVSGALKSLLFGGSYILSRFISADYADELKRILQSDKYDIVQLETIYLAHYIPLIRKHSRAVISLRSHNVEHEIWARHAANTNWLPKKWYLNLQYRQLREFEAGHMSELDILVAITKRDLDEFQKLGYKKASVVAPVGISLDEYEPDLSCFAKKPTMAFIGALDWMPNQEGLLWFIKKVWPLLHQKYPLTELHIAGKNTPSWLKRKAKRGIFFHGEVENAKQFLNEHTVMIAPLFSGSGIKVKVLEGMALSRVVMATPIALEGIPVRTGEHVLAFNSPQEFVQSFTALQENTNTALNMGKSAREFIRRNFDNNAIAREVLMCYQNNLPK